MADHTHLLAARYARIIHVIIFLMIAMEYKIAITCQANAIVLAVAVVALEHKALKEHKDSQVHQAVVVALEPQEPQEHKVLQAHEDLLEQLELKEQLE
jgi:hypothetical protein